MTGDWPFPFWIAHRGAGKLAPENTLAAFRLGARHGYAAFECDVKLSADGVPFLLHDATLERTTNGRGVGGDLPWGELSRLDAGAWHSPAYAGEPPATLQAVAAFLQANGFWLDLEIKPTPGTEAQTGAAVAEAVARLWHERVQPPLLSSFRPDALRAARDAAPQLQRALLLDKLPADPLALASELRCVAVITDHRLMDAALVGRLHAAGLRAMVYTVNDGGRAQALQALGIDGLVTDAVDRLGPGAQLR
ncbi:MAG: glycerophosphodiester phosphodiesterase [Burkholderiales bacterium]|nr:glycerophosphodiester phosphodiesterase [Burkholderiales bacterium]